jgi:hypothetical protein
MITITSPDDGSRLSTTEMITFTGSFGPVASYSLQQVIGNQITNVPDPASNDSMKNQPDWSITLKPIATTGDYIFTVFSPTGNPPRTAARSFSVTS